MIYLSVLEDSISRAQIKLVDVADTLQGDWVILAQHLKLQINWFYLSVLEDSISRAQIKLVDVADTLQGDWVILAQHLKLQIN